MWSKFRLLWAKDVLDVVALSSPPSRSFRKVDPGTESASSAGTAPRPWTPLLRAMVRTMRYTAKLAMARSGDPMVTDSPVDPVFCKPMALRKLILGRSPNILNNLKCNKHLKAYYL